MPWAFQIITLAVLAGYIGFNEYQKRNSDALMASELHAEIGALDGIEVRGLRVIDGSERVRFEVKAGEKETDLTLFDLNGLRRLSMSSKHTETALSLYDREEHLLTSLSEKEGASLKMFYESGSVASAFETNERSPGVTKGSGLRFYNKSDQMIVSLFSSLEAGASSLLLSDGDGDNDERCILGVFSGRSSFSLSSWEDGATKEEIRLDRIDGESSLTLKRNDFRTALLSDAATVEGGAFQLYRNDGELFFDVAQYMDNDPYLRISGGKKASAVMTAGDKDDSVSDSQLYFTDANGIVRSQLGIFPKTNLNGLFLLDKSSKTRISVRENNGASGLSVSGEDGVAVGELYQLNSKPSLYFMEDGKEILRVPK